MTSREAVILSVVRDRSCYGVQIRQKYERQTGELIPSGSLYTTLKRMLDKKLLKSEKQRGKFKYYSVTAHGNRLLDSFILSCGMRSKTV